MQRDSSIQLIVGLGNPGDQYTYTRHNAGVWYITQMFSRFDLPPMQLNKKFHGWVGQVEIDGHKVHVLTPNTFMNLSGQAVRAIIQFYKIPVDRILVAHDELSLPCGTVRIKKGGGHAGHNGLRDIISQLSSPDFLRLRIGIDHPGHKDAVTPYVLSRPPQADAVKIHIAIDHALAVLPHILSGDIEKAMQELHA